MKVFVSDTNSVESHSDIVEEVLGGGEGDGCGCVVGRGNMKDCSENSIRWHSYITELLHTQHPFPYTLSITTTPDTPIHLQMIVCGHPYSMYKPAAVAYTLHNVILMIPSSFNKEDATVGGKTTDLTLKPFIASYEISKGSVSGDVEVALKENKFTSIGIFQAWLNDSIR